MRESGAKIEQSVQGQGDSIWDGPADALDNVRCPVWCENDAEDVQAETTDELFWYCGAQAELCGEWDLAGAEAGYSEGAVYMLVADVHGKRF